MATKSTMEASQIEAVLNELEIKLQRLRSLYEQYFMGIERVPPTTARKEVFRIIQAMENTYIRNTALKFRLRSLVQRFNSYKAYWNRIERQIEEGTYVRDVKRAARNKDRRQRREQVQDDAMPILELDLEMVEDLGDLQAELEELDAQGAFDGYDSRSRPAASQGGKQAKLDAIRQQLMAESGGTPAAQPAAAQPPANSREAKLAKLKSRLNNSGSAPLPTGGASMEKLRELHAKKQEQKERVIQRNAPARNTSSQRVIQRNAPARAGAPAGGGDQARDVYNKLLQAKKRCNESTSGLTYESVKQSMRQQSDHLKRTRGANNVDFKVVIKDGRAFLKPVPK